MDMDNFIVWGCGGGGEINRPEVIVSKFISISNRFLFRHALALIQKFWGANFTVHVYIYVTFRESEERTCRSCRYNSNSILVYGTVSEKMALRYTILKL